MPMARTPRRLCSPSASTPRAFRSRRRLSVQPLAPRGFHRRVSRQFAILMAPTSSPFSGRRRLGGTLIAPPSPNGCSLANAYVDLGTWWCMTPFLGAGIGIARVTIANFTDQGITDFGGRHYRAGNFGDNVAKWNFAWALHAGLAYHVNPTSPSSWRTAIVDLGDGLTGAYRPSVGPTTSSPPIDVQEHYLAGPDAGRALESRQSRGLYAPPLMRKG